MIRDLKQVSEERFDWLLGVLPPMKWRGSRGSQSFMLSEMMDFEVTTICAELGGDFFEMLGPPKLTHEEIVAAVRQFMQDEGDRKQQIAEQAVGA